MSNTGLYTIGGGHLLRDARCTALAPFVGPSWVEACRWQDHHRGYPTRAVEDTDQITCGECQRIASQTGLTDIRNTIPAGRTGGTRMDDDYLFDNLDIGYCPHCGRLLESYDLVVCANCEEAE